MKDYSKVIFACKELLFSFPEAEEVKEYALKRLSRENLDLYNFGYFPNHNNLDVLISMVGEEHLASLNLLYSKMITSGINENMVRYSTMKDHNLIMPYKDVYGNCIAIVGRSILSDEERSIKNIAKYKNSIFNKGHHLFGLDTAKHSIVKNDFAIIVEGQLDTIAAHSRGLQNVVALGSSNMTFDQFALLTRYTSNLTLLLDNDEAGNMGADKIMNSYNKYANIKKMFLPEGYKDIDAYLNETNDIGMFK